MENAVRVLVPTHTAARAEGFRNARDRRERAQGKLKSPGEVGRAIFFGQRESLFLIQAEFAGLIVVGDVASGSL